MLCINSINEILDYLQNLKSDDWLVVDVDNTLIMPKAEIFKANSPDKYFIDEFKKNPTPDLANKLSLWRLKRKIQLVENEWINIFDFLLNNKVSIYALTQMETGSYGVIPSVEKWRSEELKSIGLLFSNYPENEIDLLLKSKKPATVYKGIMFTGEFKKSEVLNEFIYRQKIKPKKIVFIDDKKEQIEDLENYFIEKSIDHLCVHYNAASKIFANSSFEKNTSQIESFLQGKWFE